MHTFRPSRTVSPILDVLGGLSRVPGSMTCVEKKFRKKKKIKVLVKECFRTVLLKSVEGMSLVVAPDVRPSGGVGLTSDA